MYVKNKAYSYSINYQQISIAPTGISVMITITRKSTGGSLPEGDADYQYESDLLNAYGFPSGSSFNQSTLTNTTVIPWPRLAKAVSATKK